MIKAEPKGEVNIPSCSVLFVLLAATAIKPARKRRIDHFRRIRSIIDIDRSTSQAAVFHHHRRYAQKILNYARRRIESGVVHIGSGGEDSRSNAGGVITCITIVRSGGAGISSVRSGTSLASQPLHKKRKGLVRRRYSSCSACWNAINITHATYFYASLAHCGDKLTAHTGLVYSRPGALLHVWFTLTYTYRGHAAATKFAYSYSPGFLGKRTTRVTEPYQTLPFL